MASIADWQPIETAPTGKNVLLWWIGERRLEYPKGPAPATVVVGYLLSYELGMVWDGSLNLPVRFFTHWAPLPLGPNGETPGVRE